MSRDRAFGWAGLLTAGAVVATINVVHGGDSMLDNVVRMAAFIVLVVQAARAWGCAARTPEDTDGA